MTTQNLPEIGSKPCRRHTPPFRTPTGEVLPGSIAEIGYQRLGGIDQFVMIRGEDLANPPMIILHGGPGFSDTTFMRHFNTPLEKAFTMVYWDQRGTGFSFDSTIPRSSMTVEQFLSDLDELVELVRKRTNKNKIVLFGHSWGSALGVIYCVRYPEKIAAYVGCAQYGDAAVSESASYAYAVREAERLGNRKALKQLRAIGPPPYGASSLMAERMWIQRLDGQMQPKSLWKMARMILGARELSIFDLSTVIRAFRFSLDAMWDEASKINLFELAPSLEMPAFFFLGRRDHWIPPETSLPYIDVLRAPSKKLVWFEESGHEPFVDEPERFNRAMIELVRPTLWSVT